MEDQPALAALVEAYREASRAGLRAELQGKRGADAAVTSDQRRDEIAEQLRAQGEDGLRVSLICEHAIGGDVIAHLTGMPLSAGAFQDGLDAALRDLQGQRARTAQRIAEPI